ncbi:nitroreductase [Hydrogenovibrio sp. JE_KL2]|uniref:nitroreductase n=1 Tax=Hydrogenovibrio sp. JE_KL2 TaxID=2651188 RepID=UPI00128B77C1|nr:nitroreductase [Hydrogenovibrio sp. JE_KL2]MPQ76724.1 nitroreductase [Hydrogenovibrio sp. JE_KL2]
MTSASTSVSDAIRQRHSVRAFLPTSVEEKLIHDILDDARFAPSGVNTQPWQVAVVSGETKTQLQNKMVAAFEAGETGQMDYQYYPKNWVAPFKQRRVTTGVALYNALKIEREDKAARLAQWAANYRSFDAPVSLFFFMDPSLETGSYFDYGMFAQNIMLLAVEKGLATCPQGALGEYPTIIKQHLGYDNDMILLGGMALGYEDKEHPVNSYRTEREAVNDFTRFFD